MPAPLEFATASAEETAALAARLAHACARHDCIALTGDLGAGKTVFARGFIQALAGEVEVTSPTFTLAQSYPLQASQLTLWHFDLYRIEHADELHELGIEDALEDGIALIEWPQIADTLLPKDRLEVHIRPGKSEQERFVMVSAPDAWYKKLTSLMDV